MEKITKPKDPKWDQEFWLYFLYSTIFYIDSIEWWFYWVMVLLSAGST